MTEARRRRLLTRAAIVSGVALLSLALASPAAPQGTFDLLIRNGLVVDGSGSGGFPADVGIRNGEIVRVGDLSEATAGRTIDASSLVVAPGFIDIHNHSDFTLLKEPRCESMIRQGVTTMVLGEGGSAGPVEPGEHEWTTLGGYFGHVEAAPTSARPRCGPTSRGTRWSPRPRPRSTP
jgi:N-acyl-D-aspartate/D-glutamate deacylase